MPSGIKIDNVSRTIFIKSATNILSAFLPMKKYTVGVPFRACFIRLVFQYAYGLLPQSFWNFDQMQALVHASILQFLSLYYKTS